MIESRTQGERKEIPAVFFHDYVKDLRNCIVDIIDRPI